MVVGEVCLQEVGVWLLWAQSSVCSGWEVSWGGKVGAIRLWKALTASSGV